jgi:hypothetical protein
MIQKSEDGYYYIKNKDGILQKFEKLEGSRRQVWNGIAFKTPGNLTRKNLVRNSRHHIVSKKNIFQIKQITICLIMGIMVVLEKKN